MRKTFATWATDKLNDPDFYLITPDLGFGVLEPLKSHPRFFNVGIREELAVDIAIGLALAKKRPYVYGIATFILYGALEQIRNYLIGQQLPIVIVGCGRDMTYDKLDMSHWAIDDVKVLEAVGDIEIYTPINEEHFERFLDLSWEKKKPMYLRIP